MNNEKYINTHEWELAILHKEALATENYEECQVIQDEVDKRIASGTINKALMNGFKYYNPKSEKFEGQADFKGLNGLFKRYQY